MTVDDTHHKWAAVRDKYFIRSNGTYVGDYEAMYRDCEDPWLQSVQAFRSPLKKVILLRIAQLPERRVLDIGCGNGTFTELIRSEADADEVLGLDVSPTAISDARSRYPLCRFEVASASEVASFADMKPTAICMCEVTWCILDSFEEVLASLKEHFPNALLFHTLTFYDPGEQKYGTEYFTRLEELLPYFSQMTIEETFLHTRYPGKGSQTLIVARI